MGFKARPPQPNDTFDSVIGWEWASRLSDEVSKLSDLDTSGSPSSLVDATYITEANEVAKLPNSFQLFPGTNITFTVGVNTLTINSSGGGSLPTVPLPATQALTAGDLVNIFSNAGTASVRKASAVNGFEAHGWTNASVANGAICTVNFLGENTNSAGLTPGRVFLSTTDGLATNTCPSTAGQMVQEIGQAVSATAYTFEWKPGVLLAATHSAANAGSLRGQEFTSNGTFIAPSGVTSVWVTMIGAGGGGSCTALASLGGGGGGTGELVQNLAVILSGNVAVTVGVGGNGGASGQASAQPGANGGDTSFGPQYIARGGLGGLANGGSGAGGGTLGHVSTSAGAPGGGGALGAQESPTYFGGNSGAGGGNTTGNNGGPGSGAPGYPTPPAAGVTAGSQAGGGAGSNTIYGPGGAGGNGGVAGTSASGSPSPYGASGGGAGGHAGTTLAGGNGFGGYVLVQWIA